MGKRGRGAKGSTCRSQHPSDNSRWCDGCTKKTGCSVTSTENARKTQLQQLGSTSPLEDTRRRRRRVQTDVGVGAGADGDSDEPAADPSSEAKDAAGSIESAVSDDSDGGGGSGGSGDGDSSDEGNDTTHEARVHYFDVLGAGGVVVATGVVPSAGPVKVEHHYGTAAVATADTAGAHVEM